MKAIKTYKYLSAADLDPAACLADMHDVRSGGLVLFSGEVRNHNDGREVLYLEYEAYEKLSEKMTAQFIEEAVGRWGLNGVKCIHRIGRVELGQCAVVVITSSVHRDEAYQANRWLIEKIKHELPIWKKEFYADGSYRWSENCEHHH